MSKQAAGKEPGGEVAPQLAKVFVAILHAGIFMGAREVAPGDVVDGDVVFDHMPDNAPGRYTWNAEHARLEAIEPKQNSDVPPPGALNAIALGFMAVASVMAESGKELPGHTTAWLRWYASSVDFRGAINADTVDLVQPWLKGGAA
jgi:hypothetical protein